MDTEQRLTKAGEQFANARSAADKARAELYAAIRAAHGEGLSIRRIADLTGVSHQLVHQVIRAK